MTLREIVHHIGGQERYFARSLSRWPESFSIASAPIPHRNSMSTSDIVRIAAVSDIHYAKTSQGSLQPLFAQITEAADILVLPGDLTDFGLAEEARVLAKDLTAAVNIPIVGVLGNHDYEAGEVDEVREILTTAGVHLLDGDSVEIQGIGFAGIKGFAGGFGRGALGAWGEPSIKAFVQETLQEVLKLESALARLATPHRVALLHYAPIRQTVQGEPEEIYPWLGSSRFEEPLTRFEVSVVFHGHAHKGAPEGRTSSGIPVYNVCHGLLRDHFPEQPPFRLIELDRAVARRSSDGVDRRSQGRRKSDRSTAGAAPPAN